MATRSPRNRAGKKKPATRPIFIIDRRNVLGWSFLAFFACGLMFVLGVLVGRDQVPIRFDIERLDEKLIHLKQSVLTNQEIKPFDVLGNLKKDGIPEVQKTDPHTMAPRYAKKEISEEPVSPEALKPEPAAPESEPDSKTAAEKTQETEAGVSTQPPAEETGSKPASAPDTAYVKKPAVSKPQKSAPAQAATARNIDGGGYAIQIASLSDPESAATVRDRFLSKGYPAYVRKADLNGKTWYRVRIGSYPSKEKARKDLKSLTEAGVSAVIFLREDANP